MEEAPRTNLFFRMFETMLIAFFYFTRLMARVFPPSFLYAMFNGVGHVLYHTRSSMREHLLETLRDALPEITDERELEDIAKQACGSLFLPMLDPIIFKKHRERFMENLILENIEYLEEADARGNGVIVFSPHLGAFGLTGAVYFHLGKPFTPLVLPPSSSPVPRYIGEITFYTQSLGCDREAPAFWTGKDAIARVREHLAKGKRVGITYDIDGDKVMDFFGRPAALASGIAHFAYDSGAPIVAGVLYRGKNPLYCRMKWYKALEYELTGDRRTDVETILATVIRRGEETIRVAPGQWMGWFGLRQWRKKAEEMMENKG